jgi:uncharacterized protein YbjT (DUF2867 family)
MFRTQTPDAAGRSFLLAQAVTANAGGRIVSPVSAAWSRASRRTIMILVTGATGKTGRALVTQLLGAGVRVRALVRDRARAADLAAEGAELVVADLDQPHTLPAAVAGVRAAYLNTAAEPQQVTLHSQFIRAAASAGVRHIVRHSVRGAAPDSAVKIARWHFASQRELEESGVAWTHLQPVYNMQNFLGFARTIRSPGVFCAPMRDAAVSMVDARDVASIAAAVLTGKGHEGKTYVITGPAPVTFADAAVDLSRACGAHVRYVDVELHDARTIFSHMQLPAWYVDDLLGFYAYYRSGAGALVSDAVRRITGRPPRRFSDFARDYRSMFTGASHAAA